VDTADLRRSLFLPDIQGRNYRMTDQIISAAGFDHFRSMPVANRLPQEALRPHSWFFEKSKRPEKGLGTVQTACRPRPGNRGSALFRNLRRVAFATARRAGGGGIRGFRIIASLPETSNCCGSVIPGATIRRQKATASCRIRAPAAPRRSDREVTLGRRRGWRSTDGKQRRRIGNRLVSPGIPKGQAGLVTGFRASRTCIVQCRFRRTACGYISNVDVGIFLNQVDTRARALIWLRRRRARQAIDVEWPRVGTARCRLTAPSA